MTEQVMTQNAYFDEDVKFAVQQYSADFQLKGLDRAIANSPPPLGDVGDDVTYMMDEGMGALKGDEVLTMDEIVHTLAGQKLPPNPKQAYGDKKVPLHLVPAAGIIHEAMALKEGARKYGPFNWRDKEVEAQTYIGAALRHLLAWQDGEEIDPESGVHHLGHARACLGILLDALATWNLIDNRPPSGAAGKLIRELTSPQE